MTKVFVLVGLPGCGKSTWAQQNKGHYQMFDVVLSSDEYRQKLLGDENNQLNNELVFSTLYKDAIQYLKEGKSICIDATNITRKARRGILNRIKENHIECEKIAVVFEVEPKIVFSQNLSRDRVVPGQVIHKMMCNFEIPFYGEGFDTINIVYHRSNEDAISYMDMFRKMKGFDQNNPHHSLDLFSHCAKCHDILAQNDINNEELVMASSLHDIGKLHTGKYNGDKGQCQYIGHQGYGAYISLFLDYRPFVIDRYKVAFYINYHMEPYNLNHANPETVEKYKKLFGEEWDNLIKLHEADAAAH